MQQEVVLAMLAKEPSHGYELRARLRDALGPLGEGMNAGQVYVTLTRLEKAGFLQVETSAAGADGSDRKVYALTAQGHQRVTEWMAEVSWAKPDLAEFHLKLIAAASELLQAAGAPPPVAFRAGSYAACERTVAALGRMGFAFDSSHNGAVT